MFIKMKNKHIFISKKENWKPLFAEVAPQTSSSLCTHHGDAPLPRAVNQSNFTAKKSALSYSKACNYVVGIQEASWGNSFPFSTIWAHCDSVHFWVKIHQPCTDLLENDRENVDPEKITRNAIVIASFKQVLHYFSNYSSNGLHKPPL